MRPFLLVRLGALLTSLCSDDNDDVCSSYSHFQTHTDSASHLQPSMHAIFVVHGPMASRIKLARRSQPAPRDEITVIPGFANLEIYNLVAKLLGIGEEGRAPNNGTAGFWEALLQ